MKTQSCECLACGSTQSGEPERCSACGRELLLKGKYRVLRVIEELENHTSYEVLDQGENIARELHLLNEELSERYEKVAEVESQIRLLDRIDHPSVRRLYEGFQILSQDKWLYCVVLQLLKGRTLADRIATNEPLTESQGLVLLRQLLEALDTLHERFPTILHKNISPKTIIQSNKRHFLLVDFDTSHAFQSATEYSESARPTGYRPMEQLAGYPDQRSDLYSLGLSTLAAMSGRDVLDLPFERGRFLVSRAISADSSLVRFIEKLTQPEAAQRFQSAREALQALNAKPVDLAAQTPAVDGSVADSSGSPHALIRLLQPHSSSGEPGSATGRSPRTGKTKRSSKPPRSESRVPPLSSSEGELFFSSPPSEAVSRPAKPSPIQKSRSTATRLLIVFLISLAGLVFFFLHEDGDYGTEEWVNRSERSLTEKTPPTYEAQKPLPEPTRGSTQSSECDDSLLNRTLDRHNSQIRHCHEQALRKNPSLAGQVLVQFEIDQAGRVSWVGLIENDLGAEVGTCIEDRFRTIRFDPCHGGSAYQKAYHFTSIQ